MLCLRVNLGGWFHRIDLPELTSIQLGWSALSFKDIDNATLIMKDLPKLTTLIAVGDSDSQTLAYPRYVTFESELSGGNDEE